MKGIKSCRQQLPIKKLNVYRSRSSSRSHGNNFLRRLLNGAALATPKTARRVLKSFMPRSIRRVLRSNAERADALLWSGFGTVGRKQLESIATNPRSAPQKVVIAAFGLARWYLTSGEYERTLAHLSLACIIAAMSIHTIATTAFRPHTGSMGLCIQDTRGVPLY